MSEPSSGVPVQRYWSCGAVAEVRSAECSRSFHRVPPPHISPLTRRDRKSTLLLSIPTTMATADFAPVDTAERGDSKVSVVSMEALFYPLTALTNARVVYRVFV